MHPVRTAARAMLASIFVVQGAQAFNNPDALASHAQPVTDRVGPVVGKVHPKLPSDARGLVKLNAAVMAVGGALMLTPLRRPAALAVAAALVPTTAAGHAFWEQTEVGPRTVQRIQFLKNLGLLGGLLLAAADTQGRPGLGWRTGHLMSDANRALHREARQARSRVRAATVGAVFGRGMPRK
jgi:putative oxidoreductase